MITNLVKQIIDAEDAKTLSAMTNAKIQLILSTVFPEHSSWQITDRMTVFYPVEGRTNDEAEIRLGCDENGHATIVDLRELVGVIKLIDSMRDSDDRLLD